MLLAASVAHAAPHATDPDHEVCATASVSSGLTGAWRSPESSAVFRFDVRSRELCADAQDSGDGEWFVLSALSGRGKKVRFHTVMPSTEWHLDHVCTLAGDQLTCKRSGAADGEDTLVRLEESPPEG